MTRSKRSRSKSRRYFRNVARETEVVEADERRQRGERSENERFADDLIERVRRGI